MSKILVKNSKNQPVELTVNSTIPTEDLKAQLILLLDEFPVESVAEYGKSIVNAINKAMYNNAVDSIINSPNIFVEMFKQVTYGKFTLKADNESGRGYLLGDTNIVSKIVNLGKNSKGEKITESRPAFITYQEVVKRYDYLVKLEKRQAKENNVKPVILPLNHNFSVNQLNLVSVFISNILGNELSTTQKARLEKLGDDFKRFADISNNAKLEQLKYFYDIFNKHTGKDIKPISIVIKNLYKELTTFSSKFYIDSVESEVFVISAIFNHYINSNKVIAEKYKAKKVEKLLEEKDKAEKKAKKDKEKAEKAQATK